MNDVTPEVALAGGANLGSAWETDFSGLPDGWLERRLGSLGELGFTTSGTSGTPVTWIRNAQQLVMEADVTTRVVGRDHDTVHSTVPSESLYGYAAVLAAAALRVTYQYDRWGVRRLPISGARPLVFSIATAWQTLPTTLAAFFDDDVGGRARSATLVHAGTRLPRVAKDSLDALRCRGHCVDGLELFGASETGLIAFRAFSTIADMPWHVVADVDVSTTDHRTVDGRSGANPPRPLTARGPRLGRRAGSDTMPDTLTTGDLIRTVGSRTLCIVGRDGRRIKPGGRWVDLDILDDQIREALPGLEFATLPVDDPQCGEHVELLIDAREGLDPDVVHLHLRHLGMQIDIVPVRVRTCSAIDRSPMGKVRVPRRDRAVARPAEPQPGPHTFV